LQKEIVELQKTGYKDSLFLLSNPDKLDKVLLIKNYRTLYQIFLSFFYIYFNTFYVSAISREYHKLFS